MKRLLSALLLGALLAGCSPVSVAWSKDKGAVDLRDVFTLLAACAAIVSALAARRAAKTTLLGHFVALERSLKDSKSAFRFHGISDAEMNHCGVTADELSYLVATCTIGNFYHRLNTPLTWGRFKEGHYRYRLCADPEFRQAWPLVRRMMTPGGFTRRMDKTIAYIEARDAGLCKAIKLGQNTPTSAQTPESSS